MSMTYFGLPMKGGPTAFPEDVKNCATGNDMLLSLGSTVLRNRTIIVVRKPPIPKPRKTE
jgi:hypothetical protein